MSEPYFRCHHIDPLGEQCDSWVQSLPGTLIKFCPRHRDNKDPYENSLFTDVANQHRKEVMGMSVEELDLHIAELHKKIESIRAEIYVKKSVLTEKFDSLSEEEKQIRRKIRMEKRESNPSPKKAKSLSEERDIVALQNDGLTEKQAKMLAKMMKSMGLTKEQALGLIRAGGE